MTDVGTESSRSKVVGTVRDLLLDGRLRQGERITEESVAQTLGVGRHTVRAAFAELISMGLLEHVPHRGARIPVLDAPRINDLWDYRLTLEAGAMRIILDRGHDLEPLAERTQDLLDLPGDAPPGRVASVHQRIHSTIVELSGVQRLQEAYQRCEVELLWTVSTVGDVYDARVLGEMHRDLLSAAREGGQVALDTLVTDIENGRAALLETVWRDQMTRAPFAAAMGAQTIEG
ncbi:GntR family transcriptional regulator [Janibacter sp. CX7]|uniref:GntR family transcriptional regulator n=1 Tax=Janibacter sp. CX7 TaxID=2963431 RepID=UPI0020CC5A79|nr:GntR family transcriptional regulator [Janibacter sp. CX7]UTT66530.1 GntR family transcriptional regulator [Janibacter sp. CX7]